MKILFYTFPEGHLVSDKEFDRLRKGLFKVGAELIRWHKDKGSPPDHDILMVKGFSHTWDQIDHDKPVVYYSIGTEWKVGVSRETNDPIRDLYYYARATIHISEYCRRSHHAIFGYQGLKNEAVIIPACEPNLMPKMPDVGHHRKLRLAITCIPRPVKRVEEVQRLAAKYDIKLVEAYGNISDFSYYHDCDGYIHLSRKEGMPNTVLEALAAGLPCIVTNYGGAHEAVGNAGIIIKNDPENVPWDPDNIDPIDDHLFEKALEDFTVNYQELWHNVRRRVLSELNDYVAACHFKEVFERLLQQ